MSQINLNITPDPQIVDTLISARWIIPIRPEKKIFENHAMAVEIASLPEQIRGFGHIREAHLEKAMARQSDLLARFRFQGEEQGAA